jgi:hypothetical protein
MPKDPNIIDKIILTENVYIYKKPSGKFYTKISISNLLKTVKDEKSDQGCVGLFNMVSLDGQSPNGRDYKVSATVLKYHAEAAFLTEPVADWTETKLAYLFLVDFGDFVVIARRNISGLKLLLSSLIPLPYEVISKMLYNQQTTFEKYDMGNLDLSGGALRSKIAIADNLAETFNYVGANTYMLNSLRIINNSDRYAVSTTTSRLAKNGEKVKLTPFINWCSTMIELAQNYHDIESPLDVFSTPQDYSLKRDTLAPVSITLTFIRLIDDFEKEMLTDVRYVHNDLRPKNITLKRILANLTQLVELQSDPQDNYRHTAATGTTTFFKDLTIKLNPKSIVLHSKRLSKVRLYHNDGTYISLIEYINDKSAFYVAFEECEFKYNNRKLFKNSVLLGSIEHFLSVFEPDALIDNITTEKGIFTAASIQFGVNSAFYYTEQRFANSDFLVLDDLGGEWADHIFIRGNEIGFILAKYKNSVFSATAFTDIIGQAQKNMGSLNATENQIQSKLAFWQSNYNLANVNTRIARLRVGSSINDFAIKFGELKSNINTTKTVHLVLNFMSKQLLSTNLNNLRNGVDFDRKREAIQILWQISSLISSCFEHNVKLKIYCKP